MHAYLGAPRRGSFFRTLPQRKPCRYCCDVRDHPARSQPSGGTDQERLGFFLVTKRLLLVEPLLKETLVFLVGIDLEMHLRDGLEGGLGSPAEMAPPPGELSDFAEHATRQRVQ